MDIFEILFFLVFKYRDILSQSECSTIEGCKKEKKILCLMTKNKTLSVVKLKKKVVNFEIKSKLTLNFKIISRMRA